MHQRTAPHAPGMQVTIHNEHKWTELYQRNNKCTGLKNLRCFPYCCDTHQQRGFCGRSISVSLQKTSPASSFLLDDVECWMEIGRADSAMDGEPAKGFGTVALGDLKTRKAIDGKARTPINPQNPWLVGERSLFHDRAIVNESNVLELEFNKRQKGWHYAFVANKHTSKVDHCVRIYVFVPVPGTKGGVLECIAVHTSRPFKIFCRRRQRHRMQNLEKLPSQLREHIFQAAVKKRSAEEESFPFQGDADSRKRKHENNLSTGHPTQSVNGLTQQRHENRVPDHPTHNIHGYYPADQFDDSLPLQAASEPLETEPDTPIFHSLPSPRDILTIDTLPRPTLSPTKTPFHKPHWFESPKFVVDLSGGQDAAFQRRQVVDKRTKLDDVLFFPEMLECRLEPMAQWELSDVAFPDITSPETTAW